MQACSTTGFIACGYYTNGVFDYLPELWGDELWFKIFIGFSAAIPYSILPALPKQAPCLGHRG